MLSPCLVHEILAEFKAPSQEIWLEHRIGNQQFPSTVLKCTDFVLPVNWELMSFVDLSKTAFHLMMWKLFVPTPALGMDEEDLGELGAHA